MTEREDGLTARSQMVLRMIAAGSSYEQIIAAYPDFTYLDIFRAAEEALERFAARHDQRSYTVDQKRERHPRAYEKWTGEEDRRLRDLVRSGATVAQIAGRLQRNRGAVRSRIIKLSLVNELSPKEQNRLRRIVGSDGDHLLDQ